MQPPQNISHAADLLSSALAHYPTLLVLSDAAPMPIDDLRSLAKQTGAPANYIDDLAGCGLVDQCSEGWHIHPEFRDFLAAF